KITVNEYMDPFQLELAVTDFNETVKFLLPACGQLKAKIYNNRIRIQKNILLLDLMTTERHVLEIVNLPALFNDVDNETCVPIADSYFGESKIYIYKVKNKNILERWLITLDGEQVYDTMVAVTKYPIKVVNVNQNRIGIQTEGVDVYGLPRYEYVENFPQHKIVEERKENPLEYILTVKDNNEVKHYLIKRENKNKRFFITPTINFPTLSELVRHYTKTADGLCSKLTSAAPKITPSRKNLSKDTQESLKISRDQLQKIEKLGNGNFGEVWKGRWRGLADVAIKKIKLGNMNSESFLREFHVMKECDHPNLMKLYAVCIKRKSFWIIMEYLENGSLLNYLQKERNQISERAIINMSSQVVNAMKYLEKKNIVHRDLAARNVLISENINKVPIVKVADFGLVKKLVEDRMHKIQTETIPPIKWTALEAIKNEKFTTKSDVWSFGVLLWEMFSQGQEPYLELTNLEILAQLEKGYRMSKPDKCPGSLYYGIILDCWDEDPEKRPVFKYLLQYFEGYYLRPRDNCVLPDENVD
ncbi:hypothetical protein FO519_009431, partial [Halicephalobus sp. NKZ332]